MCDLKSTKEEKYMEEKKKKELDRIVLKDAASVFG